MACINTYSSYACICAKNYTLNNGICQHSESICSGVICGLNAGCQETMNGPICACSVGFIGDGEICNAIDSLPYSLRIQALKTDWTTDKGLSLQMQLNNQYTNYILMNITFKTLIPLVTLSLYPADIDVNYISDTLKRILYTQYHFNADFVIISSSVKSLLKRDTTTINTYAIIDIEIKDSSSLISCINNPCHPARPCFIFQNKETCGNCNPGWMNFGDTACIDINECLEPGEYCHSARECFNTQGGFTCGTCKAPYLPLGDTDCFIPRSLDVNCSYTWSSWSKCSLACDMGSKKRSAIISIPSNANGVPCPNDQEVNCHSDPCPTSNGCYNLFPSKVMVYQAQNSNGLCISYCRGLGYTVAGTTGIEGTWCHCGHLDMIDENARVTDTNCSVICPEFSQVKSPPNDLYLQCGSEASFQSI